MELFLYLKCFLQKKTRLLYITFKVLHHLSDSIFLAHLASSSFTIYSGQIPHYFLTMICPYSVAAAYSTWPIFLLFPSKLLLTI